MWLLKAALILTLSTPNLALVVHAQEQGNNPAEPNYEFFSGTISDLPGGRIGVTRAVVGKPAENRNFLIDNETKIEGTLKIKARVTVGFKPTPDGDLAIRIIVRPQEKQP